MNQAKVDAAIERLKKFETPTGYQIGYSGGKDSDCIKILAKLADVNHIVVHNLTTVDAPETVRYIKSQDDVIISRPYTTMWKLIESKRIPPSRTVRYCCDILKERPTLDNRVMVTGVRRAESFKRRDRAMLQINGKPQKTAKKAETIGTEHTVNKYGLQTNAMTSEAQRLVWCCQRTNEIILNPIIDWTDQDVWEFLNHYGCESNPLYHCGFGRVGCVGCPLGGAKQQKKQFAQYPIYYQNYIRAFNRMCEKRIEDGLPTQWRTGQDVMNWWLDIDPNQMVLDFGGEE